MEMVGIGAQVGGKGDAIEIRAVMPGGGAAEAGLGAGDLVLAVDGVTLAEIGSLAEAVERLRGPEGTSVVLLVQRAAGGSPAPVTVRRLRINF